MSRSIPSHLNSRVTSHAFGFARVPWKSNVHGDREIDGFVFCVKEIYKVAMKSPDQEIRGSN